MPELVDKKSTKQSWNWKLFPSYHIGVLDFNLKHVEGVPDNLKDNWMLCANLWFDGNVSIPAFDQPINAPKLLNLILISLPNFSTFVNSPEKDYEKFVWLFARLGSMSRSSLPTWCNEAPFINALDSMERRKLTSKEITAYQASLESKKDELDALQTAFERGQKKTLVAGFKGLVAALGVDQGKQEFKRIFGSDFPQDVLESVIEEVERESSE